MSNLLGDLDLGSSPLSRDTKIGLINSTLPAMIERGISATSALSIYKDAGLGIRRQDFLNLYRTVLGEEQRSNRIRSVPLGNMPTDAVFDTAKYPIKGEYRIIFESKVRNSETGVIEIGHFGVDFNRLDTMQNILNDVTEAILKQSPDLADRLMSIRAVKGFIWR